MRDKEQIERRNRSLHEYFDEKFKELPPQGPKASRYKIAVAQTADQFFLSTSRVEAILRGE